MSGYDGVYSYAAPFPFLTAPWEPPPATTPPVFPMMPAAPSPVLPLLGLTEEDIRRILREELMRVAMLHEGPTKSLEQVMCALGDAHLVDVHPMEDPAGAD